MHAKYSDKQVAQRAPIAHLSPMCQGHMWSFQQSRQIPFSIDISWFSNLFETDETERPW